MQSEDRQRIKSLQVLVGALGWMVIVCFLVTNVGIGILMWKIDTLENRLSVRQVLPDSKDCCGTGIGVVESQSQPDIDK